jgi:tRNA 2-selenouridine synthase
VAISRAATVADIDAFDEVIDARSPGEFALDHVPGAINLPVLDDAERARIGTLYKQVSAFAAKKAGAACVSRNIAAHLESHFADKPKHYRPLIYCWRGGNRSGALTHVLQKIGFDARQLEGGYKAYRRAVIADLDTLPARLRFHVVSGPTGAGKSRLLRALAEAGAQVLDLEALAAHRGSVLGGLPGTPQPSQKGFETALRQALLRFDTGRVVFVESESKKIGNLRVPEALMTAIRQSPCIRLDVPRDLRAQLLVQEYGHFLAAPESLTQLLACLNGQQSAQTVARWQDLVAQGAWETLVDELLELHYDPAYLKSIGRNFPPTARDRTIALCDIATAAYQQLARQIADAV